LLVLVLARRDARPAAPGGPAGLEALARLLFSQYLLPFELTSVLLLAAMVGVLLLARRRT
jgi:NADH-quinone oxidoreductase subunit J